MKRERVVSNNLYSVGYCNDNYSQVLEIEFNSTGIYQYYGVPEIVYKNLMNASSLGSFFHYNIKYRYPYKKVG